MSYGTEEKVDLYLETSHVWKPNSAEEGLLLAISMAGDHLKARTHRQEGQADSLIMEEKGKCIAFVRVYRAYGHGA